MLTYVYVYAHGGKNIRYENLYLMSQERSANLDWIAKSEALCNQIRNQILFFGMDFKSRCNPPNRNAIRILRSRNRNPIGCLHTG